MGTSRPTLASNSVHLRVRLNVKTKNVDDRHEKKGEMSNETPHIVLRLKLNSKTNVDGATSCARPSNLMIRTFYGTGSILTNPTSLAKAAVFYGAGAAELTAARVSEI